MLLDRSYYLEPEVKAIKPYVLLREALTQTDRTAIVRVVLRSKTQLAALRVRDKVLVLQTMMWPDEVRDAGFDVLDTDVEIRQQELDMAASLVDNLSQDFDPSEYRDEYREALLAVIDRKLEGGEGIAAVTTTDTGDEGDGIVVDLMAALRESVERSKAERAGAAPSKAEAEAAEEAAPAPRRTRASSTAGAKKSTTAKKAAKAPAKTTSKAKTAEAEPAKTSRRRTA